MLSIEIFFEIYFSLLGLTQSILNIFADECMYKDNNARSRYYQSHLYNFQKIRSNFTVKERQL